MSGGGGGVCVEGGGRGGGVGVTLWTPGNSCGERGHGENTSPNLLWLSQEGQGRAGHSLAGGVGSEGSRAQGLLLTV